MQCIRVCLLQLKERLSYEAEQAVEKERGAGAARLREVSERYEQQLQTQRMRLVADADLKLEQLEQSRWGPGACLLGWCRCGPGVRARLAGVRWHILRSCCMRGA